MLRYIEEQRPFDRPDVNVLFDHTATRVLELAGRLLRARDPEMLLPEARTFWMMADQHHRFMGVPGYGFAESLRSALYQPQAWESGLFPTDPTSSTHAAIALVRATATDTLLSIRSRRLSEHTSDRGGGMREIVDAAIDAAEGMVLMPSNPDSWPGSDHLRWLYGGELPAPSGDGEAARVVLTSPGHILGSLIVASSFRRILDSGLFTHKTMTPGIKSEVERHTLVDRALRALVLLRYAYMQHSLMSLRVAIRLLKTDSYQYVLQLTRTKDELARFEELAGPIMSAGLHPWVAAIEAPSIPATRATRWSPRSQTIGLPSTWIDDIAENYRHGHEVHVESLSYAEALAPDWLFDKVMPYLTEVKREFDWLEEDGRLSAVAGVLNCTSQPSPVDIQLEGEKIAPFVLDGLLADQAISPLSSTLFRTSGRHRDDGHIMGPMPWSGELAALEFVSYRDRENAELVGSRPAAVAVEPELPTLDPAYTSLKLDPSMIRPMDEDYMGGTEAEIFPATPEGIATRIGLTVDELLTRVKEKANDWRHLLRTTGTGDSMALVATTAPGTYAYTSAVSTRPWMKVVPLPRDAGPTVQIAHFKGVMIGGTPVRAHFVRDLTDAKPAYPVEPAIEAFERELEL